MFDYRGRPLLVELPAKRIGDQRETVSLPFSLATKRDPFTISPAARAREARVRTNSRPSGLPHQSASSPSLLNFGTFTRSFFINRSYCRCSLQACFPPALNESVSATTKDSLLRSTPGPACRRRAFAEAVRESGCPSIHFCCHREQNRCVAEPRRARPPSGSF